MKIISRGNKIALLIFLILVSYGALFRAIPIFRSQWGGQGAAVADEYAWYADLKCPDDYPTVAERDAGFGEFIDRYLEKRPDATSADIALARQLFYEEMGCTEALARINDFNSGNVDPELASTARRMADAIMQAEEERPPAFGESDTPETIHLNPYVKHVRTALNGYLDGSGTGLEKGVEKVEELEGTLCGLDAFDRSYYESGFLVWEADNNDYGGAQINIVFVDRPDRIFWTWVYQLAGEEFVLRGFCENGPPDDLREVLPEIIEVYLQDGGQTL